MADRSKAPSIPSLVKGTHRKRSIHGRVFSRLSAALPSSSAQVIFCLLGIFKESRVGRYKTEWTAPASERQHNLLRNSAKDMTGINPHLSLFMLALGILPASMALTAAEIRGSVSVQQDDLFSDPRDALREIPVSVALFPAEGQALPPRQLQRAWVEVSGEGIKPLYLALPLGSHVSFRNLDDVHHELFTHSRAQSLILRLEPSGLGREASMVLDTAGDLHWFCRIHARSYARIDVVDTSLVRMLHAGESFEFRDLPPGKWQLRVAAPGAETRIIEAEALTAPPPLRIPLAVKGIASEARSAPQPVAIEHLYPSKPGL